MTNKTKSDRNLTKLKLTLAAGGLMATMIGAGLLGKEAGAITTDNSVATGTESVVTTGSGSTVNIDATIPEELNLNLEAIPTVAAPVISNARVAIGRSSG